MEIGISLPLDNDGFLRRQCPHCNAQFKLHNGPANEEAEVVDTPAAHHCPRCGRPAEPDRWFTDEQVEYIDGVATPAVTRYADDLLRDAFKGINSKYLKVEMTGHLDAPDKPVALVEPDDMMIVVSPCHSYEPVKVPEGTEGALHCLICGTPFAM
jgi:hypothetical protein